jgi:plastocyanin
MRASSFNPTSLTVPKGTTVTFNNNSSVTHDVVFDAPLPEAVANIGTMDPAATATRTLGTAGTYAFHCTIHGGMSGTLVVQ